MIADEAIVGGTVVQSLGFRYQVSILIPGQAPRCGGGIIHELFVLTVAHCVLAANDRAIARTVSILGGTIDLSVRGWVIKAEKIFVPMDYDARLLHSTGDIALLKLEHPLDVRYHEFAKLRIPRDEWKSYHNNMPQIAGFGWDKMFKNNELIGENSDHRLRFADTIVRSNIECQQDHSDIRLNENCQICARVKQPKHANDSNGVCFGDDGGPLVLNGLQLVIGVLSESTMACSERESSAIYTRVSHYKNFIITAMKVAINGTVARNIRIFYL